MSKAIEEAEAKIKQAVEETINNRIETESRYYQRERDLFRIASLQADLPTVKIIEHLEGLLETSRQLKWTGPTPDRVIELRGALLAEQRQLVREANDKRRG